MVVFAVYIGDELYGLSYTWDGAYRLVFNLPLGSGRIDEWDIEE